MITTRRKLIKQFLYVSAGFALVPACIQGPKGKAARFLKDLHIADDKELLLETIVDFLIPATSTPGAKEMEAHLFALTMIDDCYKKEDQEKFISGLNQFDAACSKLVGHSFGEASKEQKATFIKSLNQSKENPTEVDFFYSNLKRLTIQGYTSSEFYLTKVNVYEMVPGRFHGCVPVKQNLN